MVSSRKYQTGKHLEAFLLLLIKEKPDHGGALMTRLTKFLPGAWTIDDGRLYRMLRELESSGQVTSHWLSEESGAPIRSYSITLMGESRLTDWADEIRLRRSSLNAFLTLWETLTHNQDKPH